MYGPDSTWLDDADAMRPAQVGPSKTTDPGGNEQQTALSKVLATGVMDQFSDGSDHFKS